MNVTRPIASERSVRTCNEKTLRRSPNRRLNPQVIKLPNRSKMRVCVISGVIKDSKVLQALSASFALACEFYVCNAELFTPVPGLGPQLCLAFPRPRDCVSVTVALGVSSVLVSGLACGSGTRAPLWPILPSTDIRVVSVVLRVIVLRSTHN